MHGYDIHKSLHLTCEINDPWAGVQALGFGKYSFIVDINLFFKNLPFSLIHK